MKYGLTEKQNKLLEYIKSRAPVAPSYEEMKEYMGLKSKSGINQHIRALKVRGYIENIPGYQRSIRVIE